MNAAKDVLKSKSGQKKDSTPSLMIAMKVQTQMISFLLMFINIATLESE